MEGVAGASLPSFDSLRCFAAGARLLHFAKAARAVALTPAAFGQRIKQLEEQLGAPLFRRTTRSVSLTEAGLRLLPVAERTLLAASECVGAVRGGSGLPAMDITIGTRQELGLSWLVPQLEPLERLFPSVQLHLYFGAGSDLLLRVRTMEIDCAVTSTSFTDPKLDAAPLQREDYRFVGSPRLLARRPLVRAEDAAAHTLLDATGDLPLFRYFREAPGPGAHCRFAKIVRLGSIAAIRQRAIEGAGVAVLPRYFVEADLKKKTLAAIFPRVALGHDYFRLIFRGDDIRRPAYEGIAAALREQPLR